MAQTDLDLARNFHGALNWDTRGRLLAVAVEVTEDTWNNAYSIILNPDTGLGLTLWQAVIAVDPEFPQTGPRYREGGPPENWPRLPSTEVIRQAIRYATH
jgi:hypothetical protein